MQLRLARNRTAVDDRVLNLALVSAALNLEETVISPISIPAVGHQPVGRAVLGAPTQDLDGMATQHGIFEEEAGLVDTGLVRQEASVHEKTCR